MEIIAPNQAIADLFNSEEAAVQALNRFLNKQGPAYFYVAEPFPPIDFTKPPEAVSVGDMKLKRHVIQFDRRSRNIVYLMASKEAMADITEWAKTK